MTWEKVRHRIPTEHRELSSNETGTFYDTKSVLRYAF